jgi:hypothetical protein
MFKEGGQGLLDIAISAAATKGVNQKLADLDPSPFTKVRKSFSDKLAAQGFEVIEYEKFINFEDYQKEKHRKVTLFMIWVMFSWKQAQIKCLYYD